MRMRIKGRIAKRATKRAVRRVVTKVKRTRASCTVLWMTLFRN